MVVGILLSLGIASQYLNLDPASISVLGFVFFRASIQLRIGLMEYQLLINMLPMYDSLQELIVTISRNEEVALGDQDPPKFTKGISVEKINFDYESSEVFRELSLEIPAGQMTVVVGPSGVGKTTLLDLIMALQRPQSGAIRIDDTPLLDIDISKWRHCLGYVPQDSNLIHGSISNNITLGSETISVEAVEEAIGRSGAQTFVSELADGVHTDIGAHGSRLSAGQRQRIALARALVRNPRLLILDEVTAALDPVTAAEITATLKSLCPDTTILAISHQKSLVEVADRVYEMRDGTIRRLTAEAIASFGEI
jgi:ATP-binding cassette subfamily C protein